MDFVEYYRVKQQCAPLLLKPPYIIYMRICNAENQKGQQRAQLLKKTAVLCTSMSY